jgi:hypothetical protein
MGRENVAYIHNRILFSHGEEWMELEIIMLNEMSQAQKVKDS